MRANIQNLNPAVAAFVLTLSFGAAGLAQDSVVPLPEGPAPQATPQIVPQIAPQTLPEAAPQIAPETVPGGDPGVAATPLDQAALLDKLFGELADPANENWAMTEQNIWIQWSRSGSPAMDLLLQRGKMAMAAGDYQAAIEHLTALTDHAPDFAEGWNARATAYYQAGEFGPSIDDVRHVLALNPRHFGALSGLGMMLEELHYDKDALEAYEAARAIHPHQAGVLEGIARLHKKLDGQDI